MSSESLEKSGGGRPTSARLLTLLKTRGAQTSAALGEALGVTGEAARQQLARLAADGLVASSAEVRGVGRPSQLWKLTPEGHARFPDAHAELTVQLIGAIRDQLGDEALDRLIEARGAGLLSKYRGAVAEGADVEERLARLAEVRTEEGYMAEWRAEGEGYLFVENHCPICAAATACQGFCRAELDTFRKVLGDGVAVERTEHVVAGGRRCAYRVSLVHPDPPKGRRKDGGA